MPVKHALALAAVFSGVFVVTVFTLNPGVGQVGHSLVTEPENFWSNARYRAELRVARQAISDAENSTSAAAMTEALYNLAQFYLDYGKFEQAASLYRRALARDEVSLGSGHPNVRQTRDKLAALSEQMAVSATL